MMSFVQTCMHVHACNKETSHKGSLSYFCRCAISCSGVHVTLVFQFVHDSSHQIPLVILGISNFSNHCLTFHIACMYASASMQLPVVATENRETYYITDHFSSISVAHLLSRVYTPFCQVITPLLLYYYYRPARAPTDSQPACTTEPTSAWPTQKLKVNIVPWR